MKLLFSLSYILLFIIYLYSGTDNSMDAKSYVKFRGEINFYFNYNFPVNPLKAENNIVPVDYNNQQGIEAAVDIKYGIIIPFLNKSDLTENNNITLNSLFEITPITFKFGTEINITPVAFLNLSAGISFGTGWNYLGLYGLAKDNTSGKYSEAVHMIIIDNSFPGVILENWYKITLQMDFAEIVPENYQRWTHIIVSADGIFSYISMLGNEYFDRAYIWCTYNYLNGWSYSSNFILGYQIPVVIDKRKKQAEKNQFMNFVRHNNFSIMPLFMTTISLQLTHFNDSRMLNNGWGSDFISCKFGPAILFDLPSNFSFFITLNFTNRQIYNSNSFNNVDFNGNFHSWGISIGKIITCFRWMF